MCLSVNKATENCCESINDLLEARPISEKATAAAAVKENEENNNDDVRETNEHVFISDNLALMTQSTRQFFKVCTARARKLQSTPFYKIMTRTTQPAHLASIILVLFISYNLWPENYQDQQPHEGIEKKLKSPLTSFIYLSSFAAHFGAQIWMTFVSGLALYFSLPRHTFGLCQEVLFPKYFLINTILSTMTLITFAKMHTDFNDLRWITQLMALTICLLIETVIFFYLTPSLLKLMRAKYQFEQKLGNGDEIGYQRTLTSSTEEYKEVHKKFRKVHFKCAMGNVISICCTFMHLYYLASKITVS